MDGSDGGGVGAKARQSLLRLGLPADASRGLNVRTPLPAGRGYGTSTADIGAVLFTAAARADIPLDGVAASRIAVSVEPTDSTLLAGLTLFDHRRGMFHEYLGRAPRMRILVLDPGGFVDTVSFNAIERGSALKTLASGHRRALELLHWGIAHGEPRAVAEASTLSAALHQAILYSPLLGAVLDAAPSIGALGVCRAHSGTVVGLLFNPRELDEERAVGAVASLMPNVKTRFVDLVDGGTRRDEAAAEGEAS